MAKIGSLGLLLATLALTFGCSSGGGSPGSVPATQYGTMTLGMTDSPSSEVSLFDVGLVSVSFVRANGAGVVQPLATRIDLVQLVHLADIVGTFRLPAGVYTKATFTLDFSSPTVCQLASATSPAALWDSTGVALTGLKQFDVAFDTGNRLIIDAGVEKLVQFDFNLDASLRVDPGTNNVTVSAVLAADIDLKAPKPNRFPGLLTAVDPAASTIQIDVRPRDVDVTRGSITLKTGPATFFVVDDQPPMTGQPGLVALAGKIGSKVLITATFDPLVRHHTVTQILAGRPADVQGLSVLDGFIRARTTDRAGRVELELRGVGVRMAPPLVFAFPTATVRIPGPPTTTILTDFATYPGTLDDLIVGDRITVLGATFDPTSRQLGEAKVVNRHPTSLVGRVTATTPDLALEVRKIGPFPVRDFKPRDDSGNVTATWDPAGPVTISFPNVPTPTVDTPVQVIGVFNRCTARPPIFRAGAMVTPAEAVGVVAAVWYLPRGTPTAFAPDLSPTQVVLDLGTAPTTGLVEAWLHDGLLPPPPQNLFGTGSFTLVPGPAPGGVYTIKDPSGLMLFRTFAEFEQALRTRYAARGFHGVALTAMGRIRTGSFTAVEIHVGFLP